MRAVSLAGAIGLSFPPSPCNFAHGFLQKQLAPFFAGKCVYMRMRISISGGKISAGNSKTRGQTRPPVDSLYQEGDMAYSEQVGSGSSEPVSSSLSECPTIHVELCQKPTRYTYHWLVSLTFTPE